jgi:endonuclease YncB( thermonuclease family)
MNPKLTSAISALILLLLMTPAAAEGTAFADLWRQGLKSVQSTAATELIGRVVGVADGDTITVLDADKRQHRIRFLGIDAPERGQPFGTRAKQRLSDLVHGKSVRTRCTGQDRFDRRLCTVYVDDVDINLAMVTAGLAWHNKPYERSQPPRERLAYAAAQQAAQSDKTGLWVEANPTPPWEFRRASR